MLARSKGDRGETSGSWLSGCSIRQQPCAQHSVNSGQQKSPQHMGWVGGQQPPPQQLTAESQHAPLGHKVLFALQQPPPQHTGESAGQQPPPQQVLPASQQPPLG